MEKETSILDLIQAIAKKSEGLFRNNDDTDMSVDFIIKMDYEFSTLVFKLSEFIKCSFTATFYFANCVYQHLSEDKCSYYHLGAYLGQKQFMIRKNKPFIDEITQKGLLISSRKERYTDIKIDSKVIDCLYNNNFDELQIKKPIDVYSLLEDICEAKSQFEEAGFCTKDLINELQKIKDYYKELDIVKQISAYKLLEVEETILFFLMSDYVIGKSKFNYRYFVKLYFVRTADLIKIYHQFNYRQLTIFKLKLVDFSMNEYYDSNTMLELTEEARTSLLKGVNEDTMKQFTPKHSQLIEFDSIAQRNLYFSSDFNVLFKQFKHSLRNECYIHLMDKFKKGKLPAALTTIFYGPPGTGKTESVYQLAKETGRNILLVNISSIKDKFVGESEKRLKELFSNYRAACKHFERTPILLFNEADALLSSRISVNSSVDMMNNSLQNILLQELEDFEGILIATTNNIQNIDKAYDRRYLYKLQFSLPDVASSSKIWLSKIKDLAIEDAKFLSENYQISGGEINNISRKIIADELLFDKKINIKTLKNYCDQEIGFRESKSKIGF